MKKTLLAAGMLFAAFPIVSHAQTTPRGHTSYGGTKTISCLQAGRVVLQFRNVWAVEHSWAYGHNEISYRMQSGEGREFNFDSAGMTCLIEDQGKESVPLQDNAFSDLIPKR